MTDNTTLAQKEHDAGNFLFAIQFAEYALAVDPDASTPLTKLGQGLIELGHVCRGVDALEQFALIRPMPSEARVDPAIGSALREATIS